MPDLILIETAIAPRSHLAGKTLLEIKFEQKFNAKVLAIWRRGRSIRTGLSRLPLEFGESFFSIPREYHGKPISLLREGVLQC